MVTSFLLILGWIVAGGGAPAVAPVADAGCPALDRIELGGDSVSIDGVKLGDELTRLGAAHRKSLDLRLNWGPLFDAPCGGLTGSVPGDDDEMRFSTLPGDGPLRLGSVSVRCEEPIDLMAVVMRLRTLQPSLEFLPYGPPWIEALDDTPVYVPPGRAYFVLVKDARVSFGLARCFAGSLEHPDD